MNSGQHTPFKDIFIDNYKQKILFLKLFLQIPKNFVTEAFKGSDLLIQGS